MKLLKFVPVLAVVAVFANPSGAFANETDLLPQKITAMDIIKADFSSDGKTVTLTYCKDRDSSDTCRQIGTQPFSVDGLMQIAKKDKSSAYRNKNFWKLITAVAGAAGGTAGTFICPGLCTFMGAVAGAALGGTVSSHLGEISGQESNVSSSIQSIVEAEGRGSKIIAGTDSLKAMASDLQGVAISAQ